MRWKPNVAEGNTARSAGRGYALGLLFTALALGVRMLLDPVLGGVQPFGFFYLPIALTAWFGGIGPAILASVIGLFTGTFFFFEPQFPGVMAVIVPMLTFAAVCACFVALLHFARRAEATALANARGIHGVEAELRQQNALLDGLAESLLDGVLIVSPRGSIVFANQRFREMWRIPAEVIATGSDEAALTWAAKLTRDPEEFRAGVERTYRSATQSIRDELQLADGRVFDRFGGPVAYKENHYGWVWTFRDISERKAAEREAQSQRALLEAVLEACPAGIIVADPRGRIVRMNPANDRLWGPAPYSHEVDCYREWKGWWADESERRGRRVEPHEWALARALRGEVSPGDRVEIEPFGSPGERRTMLNSGAPVRDPAGNVIGGVVAQVNITEQTRAEALLRESEERFRALAENLPQLAWTTNATGAVLWFNRRWVEYTGTNVEMIRTLGWQAVHHPEHSERVTRGWIQALSACESWEDTFPLRGRDGNYRWFLSRALPIRDRTGRVVQWFGTNTDITEQRVAEEQLRRSEEHLRELLKREADIRGTLELAMRAGRIGTFEWDLPRDRHTWSKETEEFYGYAPGAFSGKTEDFLSRVHPEEREWLQERLAEAFRQQLRDLSVQYRVARPDGSIAWLIARGRIEYDDPERQPLRVTGVLVDITVVKASEQALIDAKRELAEHAATLEQTVDERTARLTETVNELEAFSYSLSHDMRAPLRAMSGFSQVLLDDYGDQLGEVGRTHLLRITRASARLDQLIQDVLTYSRIVREKIELKPIDVEKLAQQLMEENPALQRPSAEITIRSPLHPVMGHEAYLMQVMSNLVYNAVKFVAPGKTPCVTIWTEATGDRVRLSFQDNGIGIPQESQERMFGMFQRLHPDRAYEGTGIGLTIVRKAVERMGGRVSVESEAEKGSTFCVELQRGPAPDSYEL